MYTHIPSQRHAMQDKSPNPFSSKRSILSLSRFHTKILHQVVQISHDNLQNISFPSNTHSLEQILTHSVSCFVAGTPISSNVFGPTLGPRGFAGFCCVTAGAGEGVGAGDGVDGFDEPRRSAMLLRPICGGRELWRAR